MFGCLRFVLALMVAVCHVWRGPFASWGPFAVFGFYTLSGYLMTLVLNERYWALGRGGTGRFLLNRALRIYPPYLLMVAFGTAIVWASGDRQAGLQMPRGPVDWLVNVTLLGRAQLTTSRVLPQSWSLEVELWLYLVMASGLVRRRWTAVGWCAASILYAAYLVATGANPAFRYVTFSAACLPFSIGSVLYHVRGDLPAIRPAVRLGAIAAFAAHALAARNLWQDPLALGFTSAGFYVSLALFTVVVVTLLPLDDRTHPAGRIDRFLGDLSYPLFLCHLHAQILVSVFLPRTSGVAAGIVGLGTATVLAWGIHRTCESPFVRLRAALRTAPVVEPPPAAEPGRSTRAA